MADLTCFEYLYNHISCGVLTFHSSGKIISANQTLLNWTGLTNQEMSERVFTDLLDSGGKLYFQLFVQPLLKMNNQVNEVSFNIQGLNGNFPCLITASMPEVETGKESIVLVTIFKILDRKKYELELLRAKIKSKEQENIKTQSLAEVAHMQAHLVRAPLANILGLVSLLQDMENNEAAKNIISMLADSAEKLDIVVKEIIGKTE
jgi:sigma-B regulation protein RsbU (phosphoserine phosphatase)